MTARVEERPRVSRLTRCRPDYERAARAKGYSRVAGVDEAGRGCLFGPVYAAAVILPPGCPVRGIHDSKELRPEVRERLARAIREKAVAWAVSWVEAREIDRVNILEASRLAMRLAVEGIHPSPDYLLVDALTLDVAITQRALIRGDARCRSIAAASILAKVARDEAMRKWDEVYPQYGLGRHKGYGTPEHIRALELHGPTPEHRRSFTPVRLAGVQLPLFREAGTA